MKNQNAKSKIAPARRGHVGMEFKNSQKKLAAFICTTNSQQLEILSR